MARRNFTFSRTHWVLIAAIILAGVFAYIFTSFYSDTFRTIAPLPASYLEDSLTHQGNQYKIEGVVDTLLRGDASNDRIISLQTVQGPVALVFPSSLQQTTLQKGQKIIAAATVKTAGLLYVSQWRKQ